MTLIMQRIKMKDAFSPSLTTCNDVVWPIRQILRVSRLMITLLWVLPIKELLLEKYFISSSFETRFKNTSVRGYRVRVGWGSYEGSRKTTPVSTEDYMFRSKNRLLELSQMIYVICNYIYVICDYMIYVNHKLYDLCNMQLYVYALYMLCLVGELKYWDIYIAFSVFWGRQICQQIITIW